MHSFCLSLFVITLYSQNHITIAEVFIKRVYRSDVSKKTRKAWCKRCKLQLILQMSFTPHVFFLNQTVDINTDENICDASQGSILRLLLFLLYLRNRHNSLNFLS